jgi:hypothetical protein
MTRQMPPIPQVQSRHECTRGIMNVVMLIGLHKLAHWEGTSLAC